eukprot:SAG25_NODE_2220_length_1827_cov_47.020249_2_plen_313_part_00
MQHNITLSECSAFNQQMNHKDARFNRKNDKRKAMAERGELKAALLERSGSDRMIPNRNAMDFARTDMLARSSSKENPNGEVSPGARDPYRNALVESMGEKNSRVMAYKNKPKAAKWEGGSKDLAALYTQNRKNPSGMTKKSFRHISQTPERILDAPDLLDDYYLNLMAWSSQNLLAVALGSVVYLWNAGDGSIEELCDVAADEGSEEDYICSVSWTADGNYLSIGTASHMVQIWDVHAQKQLRAMAGHEGRVSSLAWNGPMLASGSRDANIHHHDVRIQSHQVREPLTPFPPHYVRFDWVFPVPRPVLLPRS